MANSEDPEVLDVLTLRFEGENDDGSQLHELKATHVAEVLEGLGEFSEDFEKAGAFHNEGPEDSELLVRPAKEGSFLIEVIRVAAENPEVVKGVGAALGFPTLGSIIWAATKSVRAGVKDFEHLENGNVKIHWQDDTTQEVSVPVWNELQKKPHRKKRQLKKIMAPLEDGRVNDLELTSPTEDKKHQAASFTLDKNDYLFAAREDEAEEESDFFEIEAYMSAIDFDNPRRWRIRTNDKVKTVSVEDDWFLHEVDNGLAISSDDLFRLKVREDRVTKNGRTTKNGSSCT